MRECLVQHCIDLWNSHSWDINRPLHLLALNYQFVRLDVSRMDGLLGANAASSYLIDCQLFENCGEISDLLIKIR